MRRFDRDYYGWQEWEKGGQHKTRRAKRRQEEPSSPAHSNATDWFVILSVSAIVWVVVGIISLFRFVKEVILGW
jgi:hypothetical protein